MLDSGISITRTLTALSKSEEDASSALAHEILSGVEQGYPLSRVLGRWPEYFDKMYVGTIQVAEKTGKLVFAFRRLAKELDRRERNRQKLLAALTYPAALFVVTLGMLVFLIYYMLPRFLPFLTSAKVETPALTKAVLWLGSSTLIKCLPIILGLAAFGLWENKRNKNFVSQFAHQIIKVPILGRAIKLKAYSDACLQLALQLNCGTLLTEALKGVVASQSSPFIRSSFQKIEFDIRNGDSVGDSISRDVHAPPILTQMLVTGEEIGRLSEFLDRTGKLLEEEHQRKTETFFQLLEPVMLMFMGLSVGLVVLACFLPIYQLSSGAL